MKELWKTLQYLDPNAMEGNKTKVFLNKDGIIQFEPSEDEVYPNLVKKLSIAPNEFNSGTTKDYYTGTFNNNINEFQPTYPKMALMIQ